MSDIILEQLANVQSKSNDSSVPSLFDIKYQIRGVKTYKASIGTILLVLSQKVDAFAKTWNIQDNQYEIFNHISSFYDSINKLYSEALNVSTSFDYVEMIKLLFENKTDGKIWIPNDLQKMYVPYPVKYINKCDYYELINLLCGKVRIFATVLKNNGYNRKFSTDITELSNIFEKFVNELPECKKKIFTKSVPRKNEETDEIEVTLYENIEYYEEFADLVFTNFRTIEIQSRSNKNNNHNKNNHNKNNHNNNNK